MIKRYWDLFLLAAIVLASLVAMLLSGCQSAPPIKDVVATPEQLSWNNTDWTMRTVIQVEDYLENFEKAQDVTEFCPKYKSLKREDRVHFWSEFISQMAKYESGWKPEAIYRECSKTSCIYGTCQYHETYGYCMKGGSKLDGGLVISRGLTQISFESAVAYGCPVKVPKDLHDPGLNIYCTADIMLKLIKKHNRISFDKGNYWSVLKPGSKFGKVPQIKSGIRTHVKACN